MSLLDLLTQAQDGRGLDELGRALSVMTALVAVGSLGDVAAAVCRDIQGVIG